jgi:integrase/recombinase XerD
MESVVCFAKVTLRDMNDDEKLSDSSTEIEANPVPIPDSPGQEPDLTPAFATPIAWATNDARRPLAEACRSWLSRSPSHETRLGYARDLAHFFRFHSIADGEWERLPTIRPLHVSAWRDELLARGYTNSAVSRKLTVIRSLFSYLRAYGYTGPNPADTAYVACPPVPRDGKTVGLTPENCRRLLDAPPPTTPEGIRDRAIFAVLAYTGCRVGELCRLRVGDFKSTSGHRVLEIRGKGGKERRVPVHAEGAERLDAWISHAGVQDADAAPLFRPTLTARGRGFDGFDQRPITRRGVQYLVARYVKQLALDPNVTVHSFRVTALTTARERGADIVDLQDFAGHSDPRTTLTYIRNRDRLSRSPAYVLRY